MLMTSAKVDPVTSGPVPGANEPSSACRKDTIADGVDSPILREVVEDEEQVPRDAAELLR